MKDRVLDAHAHCGRQFRQPPQDIADYLACVGDSGIAGAVFFPPVVEVYNRHDPGFEDGPEWQKRRERANQRLLELGDEELVVCPFFFVWNDFAMDQLTPRHKGIK